MKGIFLWCFVLVFSYFGICKKKDSVATLLEKERVTYSKTPCKKSSTNDIMALRISGPREKLLACLLKAMKSSSEPYLYAILGETYDKMGDAAKANILFIMEACVAENGADTSISPTCM